jgi:type II secretory pathway pseudopilin PulG
MKHSLNRTKSNAGISLVECVISMGVLAVIAPISLATMSQAGLGSRSARAETRAPAIVESCMSEVRAAQAGKKTLLTGIHTGTPFPSGGGILCLGFDSTGKLLGTVDESTYSQGARDKIDGKDVVYLATVNGEEVREGETTMLDVKVTVESPASSPSNKRSQIDFLTRTP